MDWLAVLHGDCRDVLPTLPDESVHCVVTSPPYWGLRDYGTASWDGGDAECDHRSPTMREGRNENRQKLAGSEATNAAQLLLAARTGCGKCGAIRIDNQIGLEPTPEQYVETMVDVFREVRRVLRKDGTLWLNLGDSYNTAQAGNKTPSGFSQTRPSRLSGNGDQETVRHGRGLISGLKPKDLVGIPWRVAFALQADGWYLRSDIIWAKPNPMPESVTDRPTKSHEYLFLLTRSERYHYDADAIREDARYAGPNGAQHSPYGQGFTRRSKETSGNLARKPRPGLADDPRNQMGNVPWTFEGLARNRRSVWTIATQPYPGAHFATFPPKLVEPCILAGCPEGGTVLDPFAGTGTVGMVAQKLSRRAVLIDLNGDYLDQLRTRNAQTPLGLTAA